VLGHDQDQAGGGLDQNQAPNVIFDGLRIHSTMLTPSWIRAISMGSNPTSFGTTLWSNWCVFISPSTPSSSYHDSSYSETNTMEGRCTAFTSHFQHTQPALERPSGLTGASQLYSPHCHVLFLPTPSHLLCSLHHPAQRHLTFLSAITTSSLAVKQ
jgi:hypothetical protein